MAYQHQRLKVLGEHRVDMRLWDTGVKLYALPYYATANTIKTEATCWQVPACVGKGLGLCLRAANRAKAVEMLVKEFPESQRRRRT